MKIKQLLIPAASILFAVSANASFSISGTSLNNATTLADGQVGAYLVSTDGSSFGDLSSLGAGLSITDSATYGGSFAFVGENTASFFFGATTLASGVTFDLTGGITTGDAFAVLLYDASTTNTVGGDSYQIWTSGDWTVGSDGSAGSFGSEYTTLTAGSSFSGSVVPEPSTYAALAGLCALSVVMVRRRRA